MVLLAGVRLRLCLPCRCYFDCLHPLRQHHKARGVAPSAAHGVDSKASGHLEQTESGQRPCGRCSTNGEQQKTRSRTPSFGLRWGARCCRRRKTCYGGCDACSAQPTALRAAEACYQPVPRGVGAAMQPICACKPLMSPSMSPRIRLPNAAEAGKGQTLICI